MTEPRFEELINLYLDNEIGRHELGELKSAIRDNVLRRQKFERACQLHQAARKALATRDDDDPANPAEPVGASSSATPQSAVSAPQQLRRSGAGNSGGAGSLRQKQNQARRNASVPTMAERQSAKGVASSVDVSKINLDSGNSRGSSGAPSFSFFDSPLGMLMAAVFTMVGVLVLYLLLKAAAPSQENSDRSPGGDSIVNSSGGPIDEKELMRELQKGRRGAVSPSEALHVTIYETAAGQPANNLVPGDFAVTSTATATATLEVAPNATGATVTAPAMSTTISPPVNGSGGGDNSTQLQVTLPPVSGLSGNPNEWVKMPVPQVTAPTVGSGNQDQPANTTAP